MMRFRSSCRSFFVLFVSIATLTACGRVEHSDYAQSLHTTDIIGRLSSTPIASYAPVNTGRGYSAHSQANLRLFGAWHGDLSPLQSEQAFDPDLTNPVATATHSLILNESSGSETDHYWVQDTDPSLTNFKAATIAADRGITYTRHNPTAEDLLDHWGHRQVQGLVEGLDLGSPDAHANPTGLTDFLNQDRDRNDRIDEKKIRMLGSRNGITFSRWTGGPADTLSIEFDLSSAGSVMRNFPGFRELAERSGKLWSYRINDTWASWQQLEDAIRGYLISTDSAVRVGAGGLLSSGLTIDLRDANLSSAGIAKGGRSPSGRWLEPRFAPIEMDRDYLRNYPHWAGESSVFSTLSHEIGHTLWSWQAEQSDPYTEHDYVDEISGTWTGPQVVGVHGRPAPFQDASDPHASIGGERSPGATRIDYSHSGVCHSLMAYCRNTGQAVYRPDDIDVAFLADLGMSTRDQEEHPETYGLAGWTDYSGFMLEVSRDLQIALGHRPVRYNTRYFTNQHPLIVNDQFLVHVDAFGSPSVGSLALSYPTTDPSARVHYTGNLIGAAINRDGMPPVVGNALLEIDLNTEDGTARFSSLTVHANGGMREFAGGGLQYPIALIDNTLIGQDPRTTLLARFYGPRHADAAGTLHDPDAGLLASFGTRFDSQYNNDPLYEPQSSALRSANRNPSQEGAGSAASPAIAFLYDSPILDTPPSPVGVEASGGIGFVMISWENPYEYYSNHGHANIYRGTTPNFDEATKIGEGGFMLYADQTVTGGQTYYYWITWVTDSGVEGEQVSGIDQDGNRLGDSLTTVSVARSPDEIYAQLTSWLTRDFVDQVLSDPEYDSTDALQDIEEARRVIAELSEVVAKATDYSESEVMRARDLIESIRTRLSNAESGINHMQAGLDLTQTHSASVDNIQRIGFGSAPNKDRLRIVDQYNEVTISAGLVRDGEPAERVIEYLRHQAQSQNGIGLATFANPPVLSITQGTREELIALTRRAVAIINASLPNDKQIVISPTRAPAEYDIDQVPDGRIVLDFSFQSSSDYQYQYGPNWEYNDREQRWERQSMRAAVIRVNGKRFLNTAWVRDPDTQVSRRERLDSPVVETGLIRKVYSDAWVSRTIVKPLLRVMGFPEQLNADQFTDSLFVNSPDPFYRLPVIENDAVLAAYGRLQPGTHPEQLSVESLGPWSDESFHLYGDLKIPNRQEAAFGVSYRNGLIHPWAYGPEPLANLIDNSALYGTITYQGALLGITPDVEEVYGAADSTIELATLKGQLNFADLALADGSRWGDGHLHYSIRVEDNALVPTGGDAGTLVGAFFGRAHEAMGGMLLRDDLVAGFGGVRE